ncbi:15263_t:CDS:2, partial [Funneliformis caledonium]
MSTIFKIIDNLLLPKEETNKLQTYLIKHKQEREILHSALMSPLKTDEDKLELLKEFLKTSVDEYKVRTDGKVRAKEEKTFRVQCNNDEGEPLDKFEEFTIRDENDFCEFLKRVDARGLKHIDDNNEVPKVISTFEGIQPNQLYCISAAYLMDIKKGVTWSKVEDMVAEIETISALKNKLKKTFKSPVEVFTNRIMHDETDDPIMEWDGILLCRDKVFLCECKYKITEEKINEIVERLKEFPEKLEKTKDPEFKQLSDKELVGVACGLLFPEALRQKSVELGLVVVYPDGGRYYVGMPKKWMMSL